MVAEVAIANAEVGVGVDVGVDVTVGSVCPWRGPERQGWRQRQSNVRETSCHAWVVGLGSANGDVGIGSARGSGDERGRDDATQGHTNKTGGDSGGYECKDTAECREDEG